ncbi:GNAT family N-acetyltransferase [uncultured Winogradskyella sp.]|uniref:GNAT family N-acetyltransferase n=1 Tax=uncultured Winogradskyella sp. TaxID=395353 RepID=UPI002609D7C6|nr:GNAT family N-acetyltransferase [uncultured Winogradskyella sp.]
MEFNYLTLNKTNIKTYLECFKNNDNVKDHSKVEWQFFESHFQNDFVVIAEDPSNERPAGIYAMATVKFQINGKDYLSAQSLDTITDINYRGKGLFTNLANRIYERGEKEGLELVYGFPNGNSIHGFTRKLKWDNLDPIPFLIKPLKTKYFTSKIKPLKWFPNINLSALDFKLNYKTKLVEDFSFPEEVNRLWDVFSKDISVSVKRDKEYLDWRYIKKPNEDYKIIHSYDKETNAYNGFIVFCIKEKHEGKIAYIMELIYNPSNTRAGRELLNKAISFIKKEKTDTILSWCFDFSPNYEAFKKNRFFNLPEKLRPIELHFGYRFFNTKNKDIISNRNNWFLSYSDSDTV